MAKNAAAELHGAACPQINKLAGETAGESGCSRKHGMNELKTNGTDEVMLHHFQFVFRVIFM
jgi:hypothetical protein